MQPQKAPKSQSGREKKKNKPGGLTLPDFKANYKATAIKTVWCQQKMRHTNGTELSREINSHTYGQLIFNNEAKKHTMQQGKPLQPTVWKAVHKRLKLRHHLTAHTKGYREMD